MCKSVPVLIITKFYLSTHCCHIFILPLYNEFKILYRTTTPNTYYDFYGCLKWVPTGMPGAWPFLGISPSELCCRSPRVLEVCGYGLISSGCSPAPSHQWGPGEEGGILKEFVRIVQGQISPCGYQNMLWNQKKLGAPKHILVSYTFILYLLKKVLESAWKNHGRKLLVEINAMYLSATHNLKAENL